MKSFLTAAVLVAIVGAAGPALAQDSSVPPATPAGGPAAAAVVAPVSDFTITGAVDVATQYRFRGISQSDNKPVIQGTFTITHKSGFYVSTWGSSASGNNAVNIGGTEIDVYGGYSHALGKSGVVLDGGLYGYLYPGSRKAVGVSESYFELYGDVAKPFGPITTKVGINWAPNQAYFRDFGTASGYDIYVFGELGYSIPKTPISLHGHLGHTGGGFDYASHDYLDFTAGVSYKWKALTFDISAVGTNLSRSDTRPFDLALGTNDFRRAAKTVALGTITASF